MSSEPQSSFTSPESRQPGDEVLCSKAPQASSLPDPDSISYSGPDRLSQDPVTFLVSEYVEGELLSSFLSRQPGKRLMPFEGLHLLYALAKGVEPIHHAREYHGDPHNENVIIRRRGISFDVNW